MPLLTPELLRQLEQFQLLAARRAKSIAKGGRFTNFKAAKTSNTQHPTSNIQWPSDLARSMLDVECWLLNVPPP